ncbi:plexin-B3-like isoform X6 [Choloepus didactylus]|uniref:plexin-B3-like isoform X6 n=1 Tax=Choloepus didactylus TaxID=27675 RepID=UPI00189DCB94|nr:plexin-B3-like isoform X6 [Choloepus didactylus]
MCVMSPAPNGTAGPVQVAVRSRPPSISSQRFTYQDPVLLSLNPRRGPQAGGTQLTIRGQHLHTGSNISVFVGDQPCPIQEPVCPEAIVCHTTPQAVPGEAAVRVVFGHAQRTLRTSPFLYTADPQLLAAEPSTSFWGGGRLIRVQGSSLDVVQRPLLSVWLETPAEALASGELARPQDPKPRRSCGVAAADPQACIQFPGGLLQCSTVCTVNSSSLLLCLNPAVPGGACPSRVFLALDNVLVNFAHASGDQDFRYQPNPHLAPLSRHGPTWPFRLKPGHVLDVEGEGLNLVISKEEVRVCIGAGECLVKTLTLTHLYCEPPPRAPRSANGFGSLPQFEVQMGNVRLALRPVQYEAEPALAAFPVAAQAQEQAGPAGLPEGSGAAGEPGDWRGRPVPQGVHSKLFLLTLICTLEGQPGFSQQDRCHVASLLSLVLHSKLKYLTDILRTLLSDLAAHYVDKNPKLMLRRMETMAEKLLTNWLAIRLYAFLRMVAGEPLYMLFRAIKYQVDKGPMDAVTGKAKWTLNDSHLLWEDMDFRPLTLTVLVKEKVLDQVYKGTPFSQRPSVHTLDLEWCSGLAGHLTLSDEELTSVTQNHWKRLNTLQHYKVPDGATVGLIPQRHNGGAVSQSLAQSCSSGENTPMLEDGDEDGVRLWHLVKATEEPEGIKPWRSSLREREQARAKAVPEIYLTRLLFMKGRGARGGRGRADCTVGKPGPGGVAAGTPRPLREAGGSASQPAPHAPRPPQPRPVHASISALSPDGVGAPGAPRPLHALTRTPPPDAVSAPWRALPSTRHAPNPMRPAPRCS